MKIDWTWLKTEILKIYSSQESFFSKKRVESGIAFLFAQIGMMSYLFSNLSTMDTGDIIAWSAVEFGVAGYTVAQIQWEKKQQTKNGDVKSSSLGTSGTDKPATDTNTPAAPVAPASPTAGTGNTGSTGPTGTTDTEDIPNPDTY